MNFLCSHPERDYLHFQEGDVEDEDGTESVYSEDNLEKRNELEARLYSVIHHNDLSHSLPPELSQRFAVDSSENGEVIVSLNEDLDETERNIIYDKINLIKSCSQRIDNYSEEEEEEEEDDEDEEAVENKQKKLCKHKENLENISDTVREYSITNSDKNKINNASLFKGYENRIESSCMLSKSDWKTNANMEYISLKGNLKNAVETEYSEVPQESPNSKMKIKNILSQVNKLQCSVDSVEYIDNSITTLQHMLTRGLSQYRRMVNRPNISRKKCAQKLRNMKRLHKQISTLKKMRNCNITITAGDDNELSNVVGSNGTNGNYVCKSNDNEVISMNSPSVGASTECIVLDSDNEVIALESDLSDTKQNTQNLNGNNVISSTIGDDRNNLICNYENSSKKSSEESVVITLESSGDEQSELNNENSKMQRRHKKKLSFTDTPKKWTKHMIKFYYKTSKERRRFDCLKLIKEMRKTSSWADWVINKDDLSGIKKNEIRCRRCRERGHIERKCKRFLHPVCYMCGETNHTIGRCPQKVCLFCGKRTLYYTYKCSDCILRLSEGQRCEICNGEHWLEVCPDLWRCYHLTTKDGPIVIPSEQKVNPRRFCWVCAKEGHFAHECNNTYYSSREVQSSCFVTNYNAANILKGAHEFILSDSAQAKLNSEDGEAFLQQLCDRTNVRIDFITGGGLPIIKVFGNSIEWKSVKYEICKYVGENLKDRLVTVDNEENNYDIYVTINNEENIVNKQRNINRIKNILKNKIKLKNKKRLRQNL